VTDRVADLEAKVAELTEALRRVEARLSVVERAPTRAPAARRAAVAEAGGLLAAAASPRQEAPPAAAMVGWIGRTLLVLAGAFVLRALTDAGTLPAPLGVALGLAYAGAFVALADLAGRAGARWSAGFHGAAAALVGFPLLFEATFRFRLLTPGAAAGLLAALTAVALAVAARRRLEGLAWLVALGGVATAAALALAPLTGRALLPALYLVLLGGATLWLGYVRDWHGLRWPVAFAADLLVAAMAIRALSPSAPEGPAAAYLAQAALMLVYLGSFAARTLLLGRNVVPFEVVQTAAAVATGLGGAAYLAARSSGGAAAFGVVAAALGLAAYGVAFAFVERRQRAPTNFAFYASVAIVLVLAGSALVLRGPALPLAWAGLALVAGGLARRYRRRTLAAHAAVYAVAAALASGLLAHAFEASFSSPASPWSPATLPAALVLLALAATAALTAGATTRSAAAERVPQLLLVAVVACAASGLAVAALVPPLAGAPPGASPGAVATIRTAVWVAGALVLGLLGRRDAWREASWLVYPALAATGLKILLEDLPRSRPATLFVAFALYGVALLAAARARQRGRAAGAGAAG
jgi:hypothetical protein